MTCSLTRSCLCLLLLHFVDSLPVSSPVECSNSDSVPAQSHTHDTSTDHTEIDTTGTEHDHASRPKRHTRAPTYLSQYHCAAISATTPISTRLSRLPSTLPPYLCCLIPFTSVSSPSFPSSFKTPYPLSSVVSYDRLNHVFQAAVHSYS